jgi:hypothetical protein
LEYKRLIKGRCFACIEGLNWNEADTSRAFALTSARRLTIAPRAHDGRLSDGQHFSWSWTCFGEEYGTKLRTEQSAAVQSSNKASAPRTFEKAVVLPGEARRRHILRRGGAGTATFTDGCNHEEAQLLLLVSRPFSYSFLGGTRITSDILN